MTIEEAIKILDPETRRETMREIPCFERIAADTEACKIAVAALRTQQAPAKLDRSRWEGCECCKDELYVKRHQYMRPVLAPLTPEQTLMDRITELTGIVYVKINNKFCPFCGHPLTEEAWAELERRINDGTNDVEM